MKKTRLQIHIRAFFALAALIVALPSPTAFATANYDAITAINDTVWHDQRDYVPKVPPNPCPEDSGSTTDEANIAGNDNIEKAYNFFIQKGLTPAQAAGIVGNLMQESGVNPKSNQAGGPGRGIAQWSEGGRWEQLVAYAKGKDPESLAVQLDFLWYEMTKVPPWNETLPALRAAKTIDDTEDPNTGRVVAGTVRVFEEKFEKAGTPNMEQRVKNAVSVYKLYSGSSPEGQEDVDQDTNIVCDPNNPGAGGGGGGDVDPDASGYTFPVAPQRQSQNGGVAGLSQLPCPQTSCHHDGSAAFDIGRKPGGDASAGTDVYAIYDGTISNSHIYMGISGCYSFHLKGKDGWDYYYTHQSNVPSGGNVTSGDQISVIGRRACTGNNSLPHLHIDRGCVDKDGVKQGGGNVGCRDPGFTPLINKLFKALPN